MWLIGALSFILVLYVLYRWNQRPIKRTPTEVANLLQMWIDNEIDYPSWDYFESCKIENPALESIRLDAIEATWSKSPYIKNCGDSNEHLNPKGIEKFKLLKQKCLDLE